MRRLYSIGIPKSTSGKRFGRTPGKGFNRNQPGGGSLTANGWYRKFHPLVRSIPYYGTRRTMVRTDNTKLRYKPYQTRKLSGTRMYLTNSEVRDVNMQMNFPSATLPPEG